MICPDCQGSGVVIIWNLKDDSGDGVEICGFCSGYGHIALTIDGKTEDRC
jgi:hypothetical protein